MIQLLRQDKITFCRNILELKKDNIKRKKSWLFNLMSIKICIIISCKKKIFQISKKVFPFPFPFQAKIPPLLRLISRDWLPYDEDDVAMKTCSLFFGDPHTCAICIIMNRITAVFVALQGRNYISSQSHNKCSEALKRDSEL